MSAAAPRYWQRALLTGSAPPPKRFCQIVPRLMLKTEMIAAASVASVTPPPTAPNFGDSTMMTPTNPSVRPSQWRGRIFSPSNCPASTAVISGCSPTISAEMPAGMPR